MEKLKTSRSGQKSAERGDSSKRKSRGAAASKSKSRSRSRSASKSRSPTKSGKSKSPGSKSAKSRSPGKSASKSPSKTGAVSSSKSSLGSKNKSRAGTSKSPKRKLATSGKDKKHSSAVSTSGSQQSTASIDAVPKSTPELDDLSLQGITILPSRICQKLTLRKLILHGNNLRSLPTSIADLVHLEHLDLSFNPLKLKEADDSSCLPFEMRLLKNLHWLSISDCSLRHIPTTVWLCDTLLHLDISKNKIGLLVPDIGNLQLLRSLNASKCNLTCLPDEMGFLTDLEEINLMSNPMESLPDMLKECKRLERIKISFQSFNSLLDTYMENLISKGQIKSEHIPLVIFELENLKVLDLKATKINHLPENNLKSLHSLYLDNNYFEKFAEGTFSTMKDQLTSLTISNNILREIPQEICLLTNLKVLDLTCNMIIYLPSSFNLPNLLELYLSVNQLRELNNSISSLRRLKRLTLDCNDLCAVCDGLFELSDLEYLDLSNNEITEISPKLHSLKCFANAHSYDKLNKVGLWLSQNPLTIPPKEVWLTTNIEQIHDYMANYNQQNLDYVYYSRLVFMGQSGCGKSSLIDCMINGANFKVMGETASSKNKGKSTDYRTKVARHLYKRTENNIEWFMLDLGGEEIYRHLYPTFLTNIDHSSESSIFVIVYNHTEYTSAKHRKHIGLWLEAISLYSHTTPHTPLRVQLVGITKESKSTEERNQKCEEILADCAATLSSMHDSLSRDKERTSEMSHIEKEQLNILLNKRVLVFQNIHLIDWSFKKDNIATLTKMLERHTLELNRVAPHGLKNAIRDHCFWLKQKSIGLNELADTLGQSGAIARIIQNNPKCQLNLNKITHYAQNIGEIFCLEKHAHNGEKIAYLRFANILNCLKIFIRHDLKNELEFEKSVFQQMGLYNKVEFKRASELAKRYGIFEQKLIQGLSFQTCQLNGSQIDEAVDLLNAFQVLYRSENEYLDEKSAFRHIVIPSMCARTFEGDRHRAQTLSANHPVESDCVLDMSHLDADLYTQNYELYFSKLDQMREFREKMKKANAMQKQQNLWAGSLRGPNQFDNEYYEEFEIASAMRPLINLSSLSLRVDSDLRVMTPLCDESPIPMDYTALVSPIALKQPILKYRRMLEYRSTIKFETHLFERLAVMVQNICFERCDWKDVIVARNCEGSCFKVRMLNWNKETQSVGDSLITVEIKSEDQDDADKVKEQFVEIFNQLFQFYPGYLVRRNEISKVYESKSET